MADLITELELDGLREDFDELFGTGALGTSKTTVAITRTRNRTQGDMDPTTLQYPDAVPEVIYTGKAHISPIIFRRDRQEIAGGETQRIRQYRCLLPWDSGNILIDDVVEIITCSDPNFVGRVLDVTDVPYESELAARRLTLTDTSTGLEGDC